jgi:hypothetical protein
MMPFWLAEPDGLALPIGMYRRGYSALGFAAASAVYLPQSRDKR